MQYSIENPYGKILELEFSAVTATKHECAFCGFDKTLKRYQGYLLCAMCRTTASTLNQQRNAELPKSISNDKSQPIIRHRYKIIKKIPKTEYKVGTVLVSSDIEPNRVYMWFLTNKNKRKCKMISGTFFTNFIHSGYIKTI